MPGEDTDSILANLRSTVGNGNPVDWPAADFGSPIARPTTWSGEASDAATAASEQLSARRDSLRDEYAEVGQIVAQANMIAPSAAQRLDTIISQWNADKSALAPVAGSAAGKSALLSLGAQRVSQAQSLLGAAHAEFTRLAGQIQALGGPIPANGTKIQQTGYGDLPEAPRVPLPEKPWEYNLDLTSQIEAGKDGLPTVNAGSVTSLDDVWNELHRCFNCNFPMGGAPHDFPKVGDELPLEIRTVGQKLASFPVRVTQILKTKDDLSIEFLTLPGHVDGPGSTIRFHFYQDGGQLHLGIRGFITQGPGSEDLPLVSPGLRGAYTGIAYSTWQPYINNVTRNVAESKGYFTTGPGR